jgi:hypothetical protein
MTTPTNLTPTLNEWMNTPGTESRTVLLRVSETTPPSAEALSEHCVVVSYGDAVVVVDTTRQGLQELLAMGNVRSASEPRRFTLSTR